MHFHAGEFFSLNSFHEIIERVDFIIEQNDVGTGALNVGVLVKTLKLALNQLLSRLDEVAMGNKAED